MTGRKLLIGGLILLTGVALVLVNLYVGGSDAPEVDVEAIGRRDLEAVVSASGTIEPKLSVDMSASVMGRVTRLAVDEGDRVTAGQFLLQIDGTLLLPFLLHDVVAEFNALVTDVDGWPSDDFFNLILGFPAERTSKGGIFEMGHG